MYIVEEHEQCENYVTDVHIESQQKPKPRREISQKQNCLGCEPRHTCRRRTYLLLFGGDTRLGLRDNIYTIQMTLKKLTKSQKEKLNMHSKHHTKKHLASMRMAMMNGKSFAQAHKMAQSKVGK